MKTSGKSNQRVWVEDGRNTNKIVHDYKNMKTTFAQFYVITFKKQ